MYIKAIGLQTGVQDNGHVNQNTIDDEPTHTNKITLRKDIELTQQQMADTIGIHENRLEKYEAGQAQPSSNALKKKALTLHVSTDFLLFDSHQRGHSEALH